MDDLFSKIVYLIPIALVIIRIVGAAKSKSKNPQQQKSSEELVRKIQESQRNPAYEKALTEEKEVYIPPKPQPAAAAERPHWERQEVPVWPNTKKPAAKKPAAKQSPKQAVKASAAKTAVPETAFPQKLETNAPAAAFPGNTDPQNNMRAGITAPPGTQRNLTPLQQALVWSEILGPPRSEQA
ncbi:hypothetical protein AGMMS50230_05020 [Spirochaetia bacterium]|nr:hypothetical protein AGMMS50230_05020 [Spirochaetia bacterium]